MENSGRSGGGKATEMQSEGPSNGIQDQCCFICGNKGYSELLFYCSECSQLAVHKYCFGIIPGSIEDKEGVYWACHYCCQSRNPSSSDQPDNFSTETSEQKSKRHKTELILVEEQPKPLCTLFPEGYQYNFEQAEASEISRGVVLLVSQSGKIIVDETSLFHDSSDSSRVSRSNPIYTASSKEMIII